MCLHEQIAEDANAKDNLKDDNNDGIADVKQIGKLVALLCSCSSSLDSLRAGGTAGEVLA